MKASPVRHTRLWVVASDAGSSIKNKATWNSSASIARWWCATLSWPFFSLIAIVVHLNESLDGMPVTGLSPSKHFFTLFITNGRE